MMDDKPLLTATTHILSFANLSASDFERMSLWLVGEEGYVDAEHYGRAGNDQARDIIAYLSTSQGKELWYFQCKRYKEKIDAKILKRDVDKVRKLVDEKPHLRPVGIVFVVACDVTAPVRDSVHEYCREHSLESKFWASTELDERVKRYQRIVTEFFGVSGANQTFLPNPDIRELTFGNFIPPIRRFFVGRQDELNQLGEAIRDNNVIIIGGMPGIGKTDLAVQFVESLSTAYSPLWLDCNPNSELEQVLAGLAREFSQHFGDPTLAQVLRSSKISEVERAKVAVALLDRHKCIFIWDSFDKQKNHSLGSLLEVCSNFLRQGRLLITTREWIMESLNNLPYCLTLLSLDKKSSLSFIQYYLSQFGLSDESDEILVQAFERVDGHPYFIKYLLTLLSKSYSLSDLLNELPYIPTEAQMYIEREVFNQLGKDAGQLLERLSVLRIPFQISAVKYLATQSKGYIAFDELLSKFLITSRSKDGSFYEIHDLVREPAQVKITNNELATVHRQALYYYQALPQRRYYDSQEAIYHALEANMPDDALKETINLLGSALHHGLYDFVLGYTFLSLKDHRMAKWWYVYYAQGRALRFKKELSESLEVYQSALTFATNSREIEVTKFEIASVLVMRSEQQDGPDMKVALEYYEELLQSENLDTVISVQTILESLPDTDSGHEEKNISKIRDAVSLAEKAGLHRTWAMSCCKLGRIYYNQKDYDQAIQYLELSRSIQEKFHEHFGGQDIELKYHTSESLAVSYHAMKRYTDAILPHKECVEISRNLGWRHQLGLALYNLGREQCLVEQYADARGTLQEHLSLIEQYHLRDEAKQVNSEWLAVALWYLGEFEAALEHVLEYRYICASRAVRPNIHAFLLESDFIPNISLTNLSKEPHHPLVLPSPYDWSHFEQWHKNIFQRRPELSAEIPMFFQRADVSHEKVRRNYLCPCGSGKKYKYCHGREAKPKIRTFNN